METKICWNCKEEKELIEFYVRKSDGGRIDGECKVCTTSRAKSWFRRKYANDAEFRETQNAYSSRREREDRAAGSPSKRSRFIVTDSRKIDKRKNRENDLDKVFVEELISKPCHYCGDSGNRMTLDRKDNAIGHLKSNVVQACVRCNYTRGQMPWDAWVVVAEGMKMARERGLFGDWSGDIRRPGK